MFDCHTPGGFEAFFEERGTDYVDGKTTPPPIPFDEAQLVALLDKHGMTMPPR
jgi:hypothetical protein